MPHHRKGRAFRHGKSETGVKQTLYRFCDPVGVYCLFFAFSIFFSILHMKRATSKAHVYVFSLWEARTDAFLGHQREIYFVPEDLQIANWPDKLQILIRRIVCVIWNSNSDLCLAVYKVNQPFAPPLLYLLPRFSIFIYHQYGWTVAY